MRSRMFHVFLAVLFLAGCSASVLPGYIPDQHPYTQRFYADFSSTLSAVEESLAQHRWSITERQDPAVFEHAGGETYTKQLFLITEPRGAAFGGARAVLNIILRSGNNVTDVEIRYRAASKTPFKKITDYRNDTLVDELFHSIGQYLERRR